MEKHIDILIKLLESHRRKKEKMGPGGYFWDNEHDKNSLIEYNIYRFLKSDVWISILPY